MLMISIVVQCNGIKMCAVHWDQNSCAVIGKALITMSVVIKGIVIVLLMISTVVQCSGMKLLMIMRVVQCIAIALLMISIVV